jgi:hypothetical protein
MGARATFIMARGSTQNNVARSTRTWHHAPMTPRALAYSTIAVVLVGALMTAQGIEGRLVGAARGVTQPEGRAALAARAHQGAGPCLRYLDGRDVPPAETASAATALVGAGLAAWAPQVLLVSWRWAREDEARHHAAPTADEYGEAVLAALSPIDRFWLRTVGRGRIVELTATSTDADAALLDRAARAEAQMPADTRAAAKALWEKWPRPLARPADTGLIEAVGRVRAAQLSAP